MARYKAWNSRGIPCATDMFAVDMGFANDKNKSCGLCYPQNSAGITRTFGGAVTTATCVIPKLQNPILVIEAPLSAFFSAKGNPSPRGPFESTRPWYCKAGGVMCLAATHFLEQLDRELAKIKYNQQISIAEAFITRQTPQGRQKHGKVANTIWSKFCAPHLGLALAILVSGTTPSSPLVTGVPPVYVI